MVINKITNWFEEYDQDYFKDKIDWKFFNYLQYMATEFEDMGNYYFSFSVSINMGTNNRYYTVYTDDLNGRKFSKINLSYIDKYLEYGLVYEIACYKEYETEVNPYFNYHVDHKLATDYWHKIWKKCDKVALRGGGNELIVVPKK